MNKASGRIQIDRLQKTKADPQYRVKDVVLIRFMNVGQNYISLDEKNVIIKPGEAFVEGDLNGPGIDHIYKLDFIANPDPVPAIDGITVKGPNFIEIRLFKRNYDARI